MTTDEPKDDVIQHLLRDTGNGLLETMNMVYAQQNATGEVAYGITPLGRAVVELTDKALPVDQVNRILTEVYEWAYDRGRQEVRLSVLERLGLIERS